MNFCWKYCPERNLVFKYIDENVQLIQAWFFIVISRKDHKILTRIISLNSIMDNKSEQYKFINTDYKIMSRKLLFIVNSLHYRLRSSFTRLRQLHGTKQQNSITKCTTTTTNA